MTDDPQAMTAGPRTAEGRALLDEFDGPHLPERIIAIEDAAYAQGVAAARAAVEAALVPLEARARNLAILRSERLVGTATGIADTATEVRAALDSTDRP